MARIELSQDLSRRKFLVRSAIAAPAFGVFSSLAAAESKSANEKLNIASIGVGGKGWGDMNGVASENIVAVCDVDAVSLAKAGAKFPKAKRYFDFRKALEQKNIDAVTVSTPDHCHAPASVMAMRLGKHVYCQKPLTHSVYEARVMRQVARENKVATQMGNQGHSEAGSRKMVEWIRDGVIGQIREAHVWTDRAIWPQGIGRPAGRPAVPGRLKWDLWLGPAPERPYHPAYHPFKWRGFWDFGTGALGDMACHNMDMAFWALDLKAPTTIEAKSSPVNSETAPKWSVIRYDFPKRGKLAPVSVTWYDGGKKPPAKLAHGQKLPGNGSLMIGEKGTLFVPHYWGEGKLLPLGDFSAYKGPAPSLPKPVGHHKEWLIACKGGPAALSNFDYAAGLTGMVLLGNLAVRMGKKITWDDEKMRCVGLPEADPLIRREYREGWTI
jgi:predicted dehydrogenase